MRDSSAWTYRLAGSAARALRVPVGMRRRAASVLGGFLGVDPRARDEWFWDHYLEPPRQIEELLAPAARLEGMRVADLGCGDGIMALGVVRRSNPASLVAFDVKPGNLEDLRRRAVAAGVSGDLPPNLTFVQSEPEALPAEDGSFDIVYSWSAFEHIRRPGPLLREVRRVLAPQGAFVIVLWPFYHSERGSHLWDWFPAPFHHLLSSDEEILAEMRASDRHPPEHTEYMANEFLNLNRVTVDDLGRGIAEAGMAVRKLELMSEITHVPPGLEDFPLTTLGVSGVRLVATVRHGS